MKTRVTQKAIKELANIIIKNGYWSNEVKEYLGQYDYNSMQKLNDKAKLLVRNINNN